MSLNLIWINFSCNFLIFFKVQIFPVINMVDIFSMEKVKWKCFQNERTCDIVTHNKRKSMHSFILCSNPKHQMVNCKISNMVTAIKLERFCYSMMGQWFASLCPRVFMQVLRKAFQEKDVLFSFPPLVMVTMSFLASVIA